MKTSIGFFLLTAWLTTPILSATAQDNTVISVGSSTPLPDLPERPWVPATVVNSRYPLQVNVFSDSWKYNGNHDYKGKGSLALANGPTQALPFHYRCANSFKPAANYPARWIKPGEKLGILMSKRGSKRTRSCDLDTRS